MNKNYKLEIKNFGIKLFLIGLLVPLWVFLRHIYRDRIGAFGCFDDCFNYMGGYFLFAGKHLYSQIFFNHQPIPAYISAAIQFITKPHGIYLLIYQHRMFMIYFAMIADAILVLRFGLSGFAFALLFETTKAFLFGEHFLAEAMIVYPLVYLLGVIGGIWEHKKIKPIEIMLSAFLIWFVVFLREPYVPLALTVFGYLLFLNRKSFWAKWSAAIFILLSIITIGFHSLPDYLFNVITVNTLRPATEGNIWLTLFYPVLIFFGGEWSLFRYLEVGLAIIFWLLVIKNITHYKKQIIMIFIFLILANIRPISPGQIYYAAFHHLVWYAIFIFSTLILIDRNKLGWLAFGLVSAYAIFSPQSYLYDKVDRQAEFTNNFSTIFGNAGIIKALSIPSDTLFLDGRDDLIYFQAKLFSAYKYSWYTSSMPQFSVYVKARTEMFLTNPPTFYYGNCGAKDEFDWSSLPRPDDYVRLKTSKYPTCVFVLKTKIPKISDLQWASARNTFDIQRSGF